MTTPGRSHRRGLGRGARVSRHRRVGFVWTVAAGLSAIGAGICVGLFGPLSLLVVVVICFAAFIGLCPRTGTLCATILVVAAPSLAQVSRTPQFSYLDDAAVAILVAVLVGRRVIGRNGVRALPGMAPFAVFVVVGLVSDAVHGVPLAVVLLGLEAVLKPMLFGWALAQVSWKVSDLQRLALAGAWLGGVMVLAGIINIAVPTAWSDAIQVHPFVERFAGVPSLIGPFVHPAVWGRMCAALAIGALGYRLYVRRSKLSGPLAVAMFLGALLSFRTKTLFSLAAATAILVRRRFNSSTQLLIGGLAVIVAAFAIGPLLQVVGGDLTKFIFEASARATLWNGAVTLANGYFPLGAGFGRYGGSVAASNYSPDYVAMGFNAIHGLGDAKDGLNGDYLADTQWPEIIGESGWLGLAAYGLGLVLVVRRCLDVLSTSDSHWRWLATCAICWVAILCVEGVASPSFTSAPVYVFLYGPIGILAGGLGAKLTNGRREATCERP